MVASEVMRNLLDNWKFVRASKGTYLNLLNSPNDFLFAEQIYYYYIDLVFILFGIARGPLSGHEPS